MEIETYKALLDIETDMVHDSSNDHRILNALPLYHYTSPESILGIFGENQLTLRFTRYDCVNDKNEGKTVQIMYRAACKKLLDDEEIDKEFYEHIINIQKRTKRIFLIDSDEDVKEIIRTDEYEPYICCFSLVRDFLPMWNYYVKNGDFQGYSILFKGVLEELQAMENINSINCELVKVNYVKVDKNGNVDGNNIFYHQIKKMFRYREEFETIRDIIANFMLRAELKYKLGCFQHEEEVRLILYLPKNIKTSFQIKYKVKNGMMIPYVDVPLQNKTAAREIIIAPIMDFKLAKELIFDMLEKRGYPIKKENIYKSNIPIRY